jgi:hypothetical protein
VRVRWDASFEPPDLAGPVYALGFQPMDRETVEEIKRHFGVVAEGVRSDVKAVAEGQSFTNERLDGLEQRFDGLEQRLDGGFGEIQSMIRLSTPRSTDPSGSSRAR